ncbi:MAG: hypothetical protein KC416_06255 [Myxococcales bacterium]|nr:hypothetical protein [Myxococcales bacterium]
MSAEKTDQSSANIALGTEGVSEEVDLGAVIRSVPAPAGPAPSAYPPARSAPPPLPSAVAHSTRPPLPNASPLPKASPLPRLAVPTGAQQTAAGQTTSPGFVLPPAPQAPRAPTALWVVAGLGLLSMGALAALILDRYANEGDDAQASSEPATMTFQSEAEVLTEEDHAPGATGTVNLPEISVSTRIQGIAPKKAPSNSGGTSTEERSTVRPTAVREPAVVPDAPEPAVRDLPQVPDRAAVQSGLLAVRPAVIACADGKHGVANVRLSVSPSGRVRNATVTGPFSGSPEGSCIARAARTARFPEFTRDTLVVDYPFTL